MGVILANQTYGLPLHWVEAILVITLGTTLFAGCWGKRHSQEKITLFFTIVFCSWTRKNAKLLQSQRVCTLDLKLTFLVARSCLWPNIFQRLVLFLFDCVDLSDEASNHFYLYFCICICLFGLGLGEGRERRAGCNDVLDDGRPCPFSGSADRAS